MKDVVLGVMLVASGALGSGFLSEDPEALGGDVQGSAAFTEAEYGGNASVQASELGLKAEGPVEVDAEGADVTVSIHEYNRKGVQASVDEYGLRAGQISEERERSYSYDEASIAIDGLPEGVFLLWPNERAGDAQVSLDLNSTKTPQIYASPNTEILMSDDQSYDYVLEAPVFGLGHHEDQYRDVRLGNAAFDALRAEGSLTLIVQGGDVNVQSGGGTDTFETHTERHRSDTPFVQDRDVVYAAITIQDGSAGLGFEGVDARVLAHEPTWEINGSVEFQAKEGNVSTGEENRTLDEDRVRLVGNTTLHLGSTGLSDGSTTLGKVAVPSRPSTDEPETNAEIESDAEEIYVNGAQLEVSSPPPEEVTLIAKILGAVLLAWGVLKHLLLSVVVSLVKNPLDHDRRREIYDHLREEGMSHHREIHRATGIPVGSLSYHLRVLRKAGLVASVRRSGYKVYFPLSDERDIQEMRRLALLANPTRERIAETLVHKGDQTQSSLQDELGLAQSSISQQLDKLLDAGLIDRHEEHNRRRYRADRFLRVWVQER